MCRPPSNLVLRAPAPDLEEIVKMVARSSLSSYKLVRVWVETVARHRQDVQIGA